MRTRTSVCSLRSPLPLLGLCLVLTAGCGPNGPGPLPSEEDLYAYSLAVAERTRALLPEEDALGLYYVGRVEQRFGLEDKALAIYREVLEKDPDLTDAYRQIGFILSQRTERHPDALEAYQQALRVDPGAPGLYTRMGLIYLHQGRLEEAERVFREEIRRGGANANTHYNLGQALASQKKYEEAVSAFRSAISMDSYLRMAYYALSQSLSALEKEDEAREALEEFRNLKQKEDEARVDPELGSSNRDDQLRYTSDTWMDAATVFLEARSRADSVRRRAELGREFLHAAREALRFDEANPQARNALISYYRMQEEFLKAAEICAEILERMPSKDVIPVAYELAGLNLRKVRPGQVGGEDHVEIAYRLLGKVIQLAPAFADAHRELAKLILFYRSDKRDLLPEALEQALKALELDPAARNYDVAAYALHANGKFSEAYRLLEEAVNAHPEDQALRSRLARYKDLGQG
jgi:tetratricopeptide (TPR) repeat protein